MFVYKLHILHMLPMKTIVVLFLCRVLFMYIKLKTHPITKRLSIGHLQLLAHYAIVSFSETKANCDEKRDP